MARSLMWEVHLGPDIATLPYSIMFVCQYSNLQKVAFAYARYNSDRITTLLLLSKCRRMRLYPYEFEMSVQTKHQTKVLYIVGVFLYIGR